MSEPSTASRSSGSRLPRSDSSSGNRLLLILLDAAPYDHIPETSFLKTLHVRRLRPVPGYAAGLASAFTGRCPAEHGVWNTFEYAPRPFGWLRAFHLYGTLSPAAYRLAVSKGRQFRISLRDPHFAPDLFPMPSVYDRCREAGVGFLYYNHPWWGTGDRRRIVLAGVDDRAIGRRVLKAMGQYDFAFVHFYEMDAIGHRFGPGPETVAYLRRLEQDVARLVDAWDGPAVLFSDHGINEVTRFVDVARLCPGETMFLDSVLARFWGLSVRAREALEAAPAGRFLTAEEKGRLVPNERVGEDIWVAEVGTVICPSFWGRARVRGMHGYLDGEDAFLAASFPLDERIFQMTDLFGLILGRLGIETHGQNRRR